MKVAVKIVILVLSITLAIGGVMIYAKTKVEPPTAPMQKNQYLDDLSKCYSAFDKTNSGVQEDSVLNITLNRILVFAKENRISEKDSDKGLDHLLGKYSSLFLKRSFDKFEKNTWYESDHRYMIEVIHSLRQIKHSDESLVLKNNTLDSLSMIENIVGRYNYARSISKNTRFTGISNAQNTISQARLYVKDEWLSNCTELVRALNNVKPSIAESHYRYASSMVDKLSEYKYYSKDYYENTIVPQVDAVVTEYDSKASALYGTKKDVNALWNRAKRLYNEASSYYED